MDAGAPRRRSGATVLHLDLDAFFASVEQRDKPSLRGRPVVVGGIGPRGVVATASYEAREYGVGSAMPTHEARRLCPRAAYLAGRFGAYRAASRVVMGLLAELSPLVEPLSLDEAFVDLSAGGHDGTPGELLSLAERLRADVADRTGGLTASVGLGTSKFIAKVASELAKPDGVRLVAPGEELATISSLPARAIPGVGPATMDRLARLGVRTVADVQVLSERELVRELGRAAGGALHRLAFAHDDRPVVAEREAKSISVEDTFAHDIADVDELEGIADRDARVVAARLAREGLFARTVTLKVRLPDFTTVSRSTTLQGATDRPDTLARVARTLLRGLDLGGGVRLLGVGVSGFVDVAQEELFDSGDAGPHVVSTTESAAGPARRALAYVPGADVVHDAHGPGWVWGTGLGRVTVRFETSATPPGPVRTFASDDPALHLAPPAWTPDADGAADLGRGGADP